MDERDFQLLAVLHKTRNITRAADLLYTTQSALSKRIVSLEQELGSQLLLRSRQGIQFTPAGEEVLRYSQIAAKELAKMRQQLDAMKGYVSGTLTVGVSINYAQYDFPDILASYRKAYPHVTIHITSDYSRNIYQKMLRGELDIAIIRGEFAWKEGKVLLKRENICAIRCQDQARMPFNQLPYIGRRSDLTFEREVSQWMQENHIQPDSWQIRIDNITTCVEMVSRGIGWAIVPEICLREFKGQIDPLIFNDGREFVRSTYLIYNHTALKLRQMDAFIQMARQSQ